MKTSRRCWQTGLKKVSSSEKTCRAATGPFTCYAAKGGQIFPAVVNRIVNYLKYFERVREEIIGIKTLADMWYSQKIGLAVYKIIIGYHDGAVFGDLLDIKTTWKKQGGYRVIFFSRSLALGGHQASRFLYPWNSSVPGRLKN